MPQTEYKTIEKITQIRVLVAFLGEKEQYNWWDTSFLGKIGLEYLKLNFPRTAFLAGVTSVSEAARRLHDERIGKGIVYHLFRLPFNIEERIHEILRDMKDEKANQLIADKEDSLELLKVFIDSAVDAPEGPVQIGTTPKIISEFSVRELAKHYANAFQEDKRTFPYFSDNRNENKQS
ncbi:MAG TPA: BrxE family protein [Spirochaetales bacterium]|nr:BrxE family protein [Spirochaetales bacterium]